MKNGQDEFRREYLVRLPLPLAQLYGRAYNAKSARERHDNAFYVFEAMVKLAASTATACYLDEVTRGLRPRLPAIDRLLAQLVLPSLGQWLGILRELARHFSTRVDALTHPWGGMWGQLSENRKDSPALLALFRRIKHGADGEAAGDQSCTLLSVLEALVQYRNGVFGHGAGRFESFYSEEMGPLLFPAINEVLHGGQFSLLGPPTARLIYITELRTLDDGRIQMGLRELVGTQGERLAPLEMTAEQAATMLPNRLGLLWAGRAAPLRLDPLLQYCESELSEEVLFLNRDRNGKQVEYLSYTTGRTERDRSMLPALVALLSQVTNRTVNEEDLQRFSAQSFSETPSVESFFSVQVPVTQELGEYELLAELGRGGMGVVYLARQVSLGRLVALKMLPNDLAADEVSMARFKREIRHLARCDDPHIVKVLASGTFPDGRLYYTMEYVPGSDLEMIWRELSGSLGASGATTSAVLLGNSTWAEAVLSASRKQRGKAESSKSQRVSNDLKQESPDNAGDLPLPPLPPLPNVAVDPGGYVRRIVMLARDVANALQSMHEQGIVHRDIKPANLMLTPDGTRVVLMDFGLAKGQTNSMAVSRHGGLLGTLRYAAPEQLAAANIKVGPQADVRGLGVTLWELLTRQRIFGSAEDEVRLTQDVLTSDVPRLRSIDPKFDRDLDAIVARATERRLSDRIQSAGQLAEYLQLWLDGRPLPIRPIGIGELAARWVREHAVVTSSATILLIMAAVTGMAMWRGLAMQRQQSREARQQIEQQLSLLMENELPQLSQELRHVDVDITKARALLPSMANQLANVRKLATSGALVGEDQTKGSAQAEKALTAFADIKDRVHAVEQLVTARLQRFDLTDDAFQNADGMPVAYGRDGIVTYRQVLAAFAGEDLLAGKHSAHDLARTLQLFDISEHVRMALDDWLILSYRPDESSARERLAVFADLLEQGPEREFRAKIRQAILAGNARGLDSLAADFSHVSDLSSDKMYTGLLLADGLLENLHLKQATAILRQLKQLGSDSAPPVSRFARLWNNMALGVVLNLIGSRAEIHEAIGCFEAANAIDPALEVSRLYKAISYRLVARPKEALESIESVQNQSLDTMKRIVQGMALADSGQATEARSVAELLVADKPKSVLAHHGAALVFLAVNDFEATIKVASNGLTIDPGNPQLLRLAFYEGDPAFEGALAKVPPQRVRRWWKSKVDEAMSQMTDSYARHDTQSVNHAVEQLRILGIRDWSFSLLEYQAVFRGRNLNVGSWVKPLRELARDAPDIYAEALPNPILGALLDQKSAVSNRQVQLLLLSELESVTTINPFSRLNRLVWSANLLAVSEPALSKDLYEAAIRCIPELQAAGFGTQESWHSTEKRYLEQIERLKAPSEIEDSSPAGIQQNLTAHFQFGLAKKLAGDFKSARDHFERYIALSQVQLAAHPDDKEELARVFEAYDLLVETSLFDSDPKSASEFAQKELSTAEAMVRILGDSPRAKFNRAKALTALGRAAEAARELAAAQEYLQKAVTTFESVSDLEEPGTDIEFELLMSYRILGLLHLDAGNVDAATDLFDKSLAIVDRRARAAPNNFIFHSQLVATYQLRGRAHLKANAIDLALEQFAKASDIAEQMVVQMQESPEALSLAADAYDWLATIYLKKSDYLSASRYYEKEISTGRKRLIAMRGDPSATSALARALANMAMAHQMLDDLPVAITALDEALELAPEVAEYWDRRGTLHFNASEVEKAIGDYTKAIALDPKNDQYLRNRGKALAFADRFEEAARDFDKAVDVARSNPAIWLSRAEFYAYQGKWSQAAADIDEALRLQPDQVDSLNLAGIVNYRAGKSERAITFFNTAIGLDSSLPKLHRNIAKVYAATTQWIEAAKEYDIAMSNSYDLPAAWSEAALVAKALRDEENHEAICSDLMRRFLESKEMAIADDVVWSSARFPRNAEAVRPLQELFDAGSAGKENDPLRPLSRGALLYRLEEWTAAEEQLRRWVSVPENTNDSRALLLLAMVLAKQQKMPEAQATLKLAQEAEDALNKDPSDGSGPGRGPLGWMERIEWDILLAEAEPLVVPPSTN